MNSLHSHLLTVCLLLAPHGGLRAQETTFPDPQRAYEQRVTRAVAPRCTEGETITLDVPLTVDAPLEQTYDKATSRLRVFYPMQFNDLTEGWNWHPEEVAAGRDYYTFKFLPLGSVTEARGSYRVTDIAGQPLDYPIRWRYDYFFAFDNPAAFYPRDAGDAAGFAVDIPVSAADATRLGNGDLRMALRGRLRADCLADSNTFWKATASAPVDFTLKKRYLIGRLEEIRFYDAVTGKLLGRHLARNTAQP